jgi:putative aminopeptidase FrvX
VVEEISRLAAIDSFSTQEQAVRDVLEARGHEFGLETKIDEKGNLWFLSEKPEGEILLCAHMDKVGPGTEITREGDNITGRLDDAVGLGIILSVLKDGHFPSVLFTVQEESELEIVGDDGQTKVISRELEGGIHNAGARFATDNLFDGVPLNPKLIITIDVSKSGRVGLGPFLYLSYSTRDGHYFRNPKETSKNMHQILREAGVGIRCLDGGVMDGVEFTWLPKVGVNTTGIGIPVDNIHTSQEVANIRDIDNATRAIEAVISNRDKLIDESIVDVPIHTQKGPQIDV